MHLWHHGVWCISFHFKLYVAVSSRMSDFVILDFKLAVWVQTFCFSATLFLWCLVPSCIVQSKWFWWMCNWGNTAQFILTVALFLHLSVFTTNTQTSFMSIHLHIQPHSYSPIPTAPILHPRTYSPTPTAPHIQPHSNTSNACLQLVTCVHTVCSCSLIVNLLALSPFVDCTSSTLP